jgi:inner membrane protein
MEPVTHFLAGACIGRAGLNRKTAYATLACTLAAEAADLDIFWGFAGPVDELKHHRGITHTFWAVPVVAGVIVGAVWLFDRWRQERRGDEPSTAEATAVARVAARHPEKMKERAGCETSTGAAGDARTTAGREAGATIEPAIFRADPSASPAPRPPLRMANAPGVRWGWLYLAACIAALSHILLDWTNNYGVRPFFPLNPRWYAGSFMFIAEPILWMLFFLAFFMPWVLGLADREIGARRKPFRGRGWAIFALVGTFLLGCWRWTEHARALSLAQNASIASEPVIRMAAEPYPINPFYWHVILETPGFYQTAGISTRTGSVESDPQRDVLYKPTITSAVEAAKRTPLGRVYLDWGSWAVVRDVGQEPVAGLDPPNLPPGRTWTTVEFTDLRFDYSYLGMRRAGSRSPLGGWVYIVDGRTDAGEIMGGRAQH